MTHRLRLGMLLVAAPLAAVGQPGSLEAADAKDQQRASAVVLADSFEAGGDAPHGWRQGASIEGVAYLWAEGEAADGSRSLCLQKSANRYFPLAEWSRTVPQRGSAPNLEVSVSVKAADAAKAVVDVAFLDEAGRPRGHQWAAYIGAKEDGDPPATHDWARYAAVVRIPAGTKQLAIGLQIYGPGVVHFDELEVRYVESAGGAPRAAEGADEPPPPDGAAAGGASIGGEIEVAVKGDARGKYLLVPPAAEPAGLVIVLPGGDGSADFHPFVKNIAEQALGGKYAVAQPIAPVWRANQPITWPTLRNRLPEMKYATEELVGKVIADVGKKHQIDRQRIFLLAWSSGGPAAYAIALHPQSPVRGSLIAMSVFKPKELPAPKDVASRSFYLLHSPDDEVCPYWMAQQAEEALRGGGAPVTLANYAGGHGWQGDVLGNIKTGFAWLEAQAQREAKQ